MNLISCSNPCVHQQDGYCKLEQPIPITGAAVNGCCYFTAVSSAPEGSDVFLGKKKAEPSTDGPTHISH